MIMIGDVLDAGLDLEFRCIMGWILVEHLWWVGFSSRHVIHNRWCKPDVIVFPGRGAEQAPQGR